MKVMPALVLLSCLLMACSSSPTDSNCNCFSLQVTALDTLSQPVSGLQVSMWNMLTGVSPARSESAIPTPAAIPVPDAFLLYQNRANPFADQTEVRVAMIAFGGFTLDFLDLTGQPVGVQVTNDSAEAGYYNEVWSPPVPTSAVYRYRFSAYLNDTVRFTDSAYAVCWYPDAAHNIMGTTDLSGVFTSRDSLRFPSLFDLPDMVQTDTTSYDTLGFFRVSDSILIVLTDVGTGRSREYRRDIHRGSNSYVLRWDPGP
jgi:hypothetical protein